MVKGGSIAGLSGRGVASSGSNREEAHPGTVEPAAYLGREAQSGRIAESFAADIVLLRADPLSNITAIRTIDTYGDQTMIQYNVKLISADSAGKAKLQEL